ncbi:MAG: hypothetical protein OXE59_07715 [Bacteroidetes bacterium]|nr:hypothetical protein [Bacteroidota bacterium]
MRGLRKPAATAYRNSGWYRKTEGDRYLGACPVCNDGTRRFKVVHTGEYQDYFFCEHCSPPGSTRGNWAQRVLEKLGLWDPHVRRPSRVRSSQEVERHVTQHKAKDSDRVSSNRQRYLEMKRKRARERRQSVRHVLSVELKKRSVGLVNLHDHPGRYYHDHQLVRHAPVTHPECSRPTIEGDWIGWGELYRHTILFQGWWVGHMIFLTSNIPSDDLATLRSLTVDAEDYPSNGEVIDQLPDAWICGICPRCQSGTLFVGALTDQMWSTGCPHTHGSCYQTPSDLQEACALIERSAMDFYTTKTQDSHGEQGTQG